MLKRNSRNRMDFAVDDTGTVKTVPSSRPTSSDPVTGPSPKPRYLNPPIQYPRPTTTKTATSGYLVKVAAIQSTDSVLVGWPHPAKARRFIATNPARHESAPRASSPRRTPRPPTFAYLRDAPFDAS